MVRKNNADRKNSVDEDVGGCDDCPLKVNCTPVQMTISLTCDADDIKYAISIHCVYDGYPYFTIGTKMLIHCQSQYNWVKNQNQNVY